MNRLKLDKWRNGLTGMLFFLSICWYSKANAQNACLEYEGYYYFQIDKDTRAVIRFYESGEVIVSTSSNKPEVIMSWFNKENATMVLSGKYKMKGNCKTKFKVKGVLGTEKFIVKANGGTLDVYLMDVSTGSRTHRTYSFYAKG